MRKIVIGGLGLGVALALAACSGSTYNSNGTSGSPNASAASNATFTYDTYTQVMVDGWDPATEYSNGIIAMSEMYETLTRYNPVTRKVDPLLATSWASSDGAKTWTFHLRHDVYFHTGRLMTAQAAKAAIERTITLNGGASYIWGSVNTIDTPDDYTLVFHLKYASPLALEASADYSAYIYDTQAAGSESKLKDWLNQGNDAGTGPYQAQTWNKGQEFEVVLKAYSKYWGGWSGSHYKRVVFRVVPQDTTAAQLLRTGQVTFVEQMNSSLWGSFKNNPAVTLIDKPSWQNLLAQFNAQTLPLTVRQALSYAIDYTGIVTALQGAGVQASGIIPPGLIGHYTDLPDYTYNLTKARQLLARAGYGPGKKALNLTLTYTQGDSNEQVVATLIKSSLSGLKVNLNVQPLAWATQWGKATSKNAKQHQDIFMMYWWPDYADPYSWFVNLLQSESTPYYNLSYYSDASLDKQIGEVEPLVATDPGKAAQLYKDMQDTILQQAPIAFLYNATYQYAMTAGVRGFQVNPSYPNVVFAYDLTP
jgi:peptide/nickel transport system substrate-binding protein